MEDVLYCTPTFICKNIMSLLVAYEYVFLVEAFIVQYYIKTKDKIMVCSKN